MKNTVPYFRSLQIAAIGDILQNGKDGPCVILHFTSNGEAMTQNTMTGELISALIADCDFIRKRGRITPHVSTDWECNGERYFIFSALNKAGKGVADVQLNGAGVLQEIRNILELEPHKAGLERLAKKYMARSIPYQVR